MDNKISKQIKNIISSSELYTDFIFDDTIGVVLYDRKSETVVFANKTALNMLRVTTSKEKTSLSEFLDDNELEVIRGNKSVNLVMYGQSIDVRKLKTSHEKYSWLILQDNSEQYRVRHLLKVADELNSKFRNSLNSYSEDSLMITDKDGKQKTPCIIHRTSIGCYERTLALLIEKYAGAFPLWLAPVQVKLLPIADRHLDYLYEVKKQLEDKGFRCEVDDRSEKIGYKIREAQLEKVPYMVVVGDKDIENNTISIRKRKEGDLGAMTVEQFLEKIVPDRDNKVID